MVFKYLLPSELDKFFETPTESEGKDEALDPAHPAARCEFAGSPLPAAAVDTWASVFDSRILRSIPFSRLRGARCLRCKL